MKLRQLRNDDDQQRTEVDQEMKGIVFGVEACQKESADGTSEWRKKKKQKNQFLLMNELVSNWNFQLKSFAGYR